MLRPRKLPQLLTDDQELHSSQRSNLDARGNHILCIQYAPFADPYGSSTRSDTSIAQSHDHARVLSGPVRDQTRPHPRHGSPAATPPSRITAVKNAEGVPELTSDTGDIFNVTYPKSAEAAVNSQPSIFKGVEQQDTNIEEEASFQPKATHVNSVDVLMQDTAEPGELSGSSRDDEVSEARLIDGGSHEDQRITSEEQLPMQTQRPGSCQGHDGKQDPVSRQHSVEDQQFLEDSHPIEKPQLTEAKQPTAPGSHATVVQKAPSSNLDQSKQRPPTPADMSLPTSRNAQQPLHGVNPTGPPRVTKNKRKPPQVGPITRTPTSSTYTAAQLYQLAEYMKEQEQLQEKQDWVENLAAKQEALDKANRHKSKLQAECAQLKANLEKYARLSEHLTTLVKFDNGLGRDIKQLHMANAEYDKEIRKLKSQLHAERSAMSSVPQQIARLSDLKANIFRLTKEQQLTITSLEGQKSDLEKRLHEATETLAQEKSRQDAFDKHLQSFQTTRNSTEEMLDNYVGKINDCLNEFKTLFEQGTSSSKAFQDLLELMKKEGAVIADQIRSSGTDMEVMKTSVENLSSG